MFGQELKKIWKKERLLLIALIVFAYTSTFLLPQIRSVTVTHDGEDVFGTRTGITRDWLSRYGEDITPQEFEKSNNVIHKAFPQGRLSFPQNPILRKIMCLLMTIIFPICKTP